MSVDATAALERNVLELLLDGADEAVDSGAAGDRPHRVRLAALLGEASDRKALAAAIDKARDVLSAIAREVRAR